MKGKLSHKILKVFDKDIFKISVIKTLPMVSLNLQAD